MEVVNDNGVGFDVEEKRNDAFGIIGMKERVAILEGDISISSKFQEGTTIMVQVPLLD